MGGPVRLILLFPAALALGRMAQQADPHGRWREEGCDALRRDQLEYDLRNRCVDQMGFAAGQELRHAEAVHLRGMIERQGGEAAVIL